MVERTSIAGTGIGRARFPDDPEMAELAELFLAQLAVRLEAMRRAWSEGDLAGVRFVSHQLRGAAGGYGFPEVGTAAGAIEDLLRGEAEAPLVRDRIEELEQTVRRLSAA